ncbi:MAG TPA: hypothetical protein VGJ84_21795, partial [Polyangiaceae bacterium]
MHALSERRDPWAVERERSLRHAVYDSAGQAFMMGAGEAYIVPFAVFLGAGNLLIGLLASGPLLIGALVQVWVVEILDRAPSRRRLVIVPVLIQALSFIPLFC